MFKNFYGLLLGFAFIFCFFPGTSLALESQADLDSLIHSGIDWADQDSFSQGLSEFKKIIELYPDEPAGYFLMAASLQTIIDNYRNMKYAGDFEKYVNLAIKKGNQKVDENPGSAWEHFYLGGAFGYRGIYRSFRGNWWGAFMDAGKGYSHLKKALELDPELYDAYYGVGAYHYWKSAKSKILWWLPFFGDERKKGIQETTIAIQKGKFARVQASYSLLRVYLEEKDYTSVLKWSRELKRINEDDPFRLWMTAYAYLGLKKWEEAQSTFLYLLNVLKSSSFYAPACEYEIRYWLAYAHFNLGNFKSAQEELSQALLLEPETKGNDYAEPFADKIKDLQQKISQKLKN